MPTAIERHRNARTTAHPMLDGETALEVMLQGNAHAVERLLGNVWNGVVS